MTALADAIRRAYYVARAEGKSEHAAIDWIAREKGLPNRTVATEVAAIRRAEIVPHVTPIKKMPNECYGAVLRFRPGTTREEAEEFIAEISGHMTRRGTRYLSTPISVEEYDDRLGGPVWYIP